MSQGDLAEKLNVSRQSVSKWETGASTPDLDKLIAMSELFQVTLDELVKDGVEIGNEVSKHVDDVLHKNENVFDNASCDKLAKSSKRNLPILVGIIFIIGASIFAILWQVGFVTMLHLIISGYVFLCGIILIFCKKNLMRTIFITTVILISIGFLVSYIDYLVRM